ncbi:hypothetical protein F4779DRAFT_910 [Xylariaceae sp. FL0662B]|nr:hypothetical protein F4779DRAFT_910 [Xylariaceae sp. FL0662B]
MYLSRITWLAFAAGFTSSVTGQQSGWDENQVNATMCQWKALRAATLKDTVYLDGGNLYWVPGMADGSYGPPNQDNNPLGLIYTLNFSTPFNSSTNFSSILGTLSKAPNGGAANNFAPNYYDGALLANNDEFFLYGGLLLKTDAYSAPDGEEVLAYQVSQYGDPKESFHPGFVNDHLPDGMTRYVTYGGAANAPSENKAWYFGGYRSPTWGPIYQPTLNTSINPSNVSNTLITLDMGTQEKEVWSNVTLPDNVPSRANPSVVWVPVGEQGILVVLGGVSYPEYNNNQKKSQNEAQSEKDSPGYMMNVDVYDVASGKWYQQPTMGAPGQLALGCAVVATAQDYSSHNIYYYGGYNGLDSQADFNDDVWILSLPSFMWMKVYSGTAKHGRAGHQCVMPYPDQMITIGGFTSEKGDAIKCLDGDSAMFEVFNLTAVRWEESYDPDNWGEYGVPEMIHIMIGGDYNGGATSTIPGPTGWATSELASIFATQYPTSKLTTFYPYSSMGPGNNTRGDYKGSGSGLASWVAPVLGVVLGLVFVTAVGIAILLYRRRRLLKKRMNDPATDENGNRIASWLRGQHNNNNNSNNDKATTVTSEDAPTHFDDMESRGVTPLRSPGHPPEMAMVPKYSEMPDSPLVELGDTSKAAELGDTGLTPVDVINKHTHFGSNPQAQTPRSVSTPTNASFFASTTASRDHASSISSQHHQQNPTAAAAAAAAPPPQQQRPDSPALGRPAPAPAPPPHTRAHIVSGVSSVSSREAAHLRQISDATVSSSEHNTPGDGGGSGSGSRPQTPPPPPFFSPLSSPGLGGPVSPPTVPEHGDDGAPDYVSVQHGHGRNLMGGSGSGGGAGAGSASSPLRRSVFRESADDLGESRR